VLPAPHVPDGRTIAPVLRSAERQDAEIIMPDNGQVERMNRTLKDATVKRYDYDSHEQLRTDLQLFLDAYNHARRLKTLRGLTPYEHVLQVWTKDPERFRLDPSHHIPGPYT